VSYRVLVISEDPTHNGYILAPLIGRILQECGKPNAKIKENVFLSFLTAYGDSRRAGGGRDLLMEATLQNYNGMLQRCPELQALQGRIKMVLAESNQ